MLQVRKSIFVCVVSFEFVVQTCSNFIIVMPATRRKSQDLPVTEPYTLVGAPKPQLAALTVNALRSHLKHYHLATTGNKAALVDRLHNHLSSLQPGNTNPASAAGSQTTKY